MEQTTILRLPEAMKRTALPRSGIYYGIAEGTFPKPIKIGKRAIGFVESEVEAWIANRVRERDEQRTA